MPTPVKRLEGMRFGRLIVLEQAPTVSRNSSWRCTCDCGGTITVRADMLRNGFTKSCGCLRKDTSRTNGAASAVRVGHLMEQRWKDGVYDHLRKVTKANQKSARGKKLDVVFAKDADLAEPDRKAPRSWGDARQAMDDLAAALGLVRRK